MTTLWCQDDDDEDSEEDADGEEDADDSSELSGAIPAKRYGRGSGQKPKTRCVSEVGSKPGSTRRLMPDGRAATVASRRIKRKQQKQAEAPPDVEDPEVEVREPLDEENDDDDDFTAPARRSSGRDRAAKTEPGGRKVQPALSSSPEIDPVSGAEGSEQERGLDEDGTPASEPTDAEDLVRDGVIAEAAVKLASSIMTVNMCKGGTV